MSFLDFRKQRRDYAALFARKTVVAAFASTAILTGSACAQLNPVVTESTTTTNTSTQSSVTASSDAAFEGASENAPSDLANRLTNFEQWPEQVQGTSTAHIVRFKDGDSFDIKWLDDGSTDELRLLGINAPESDACFGQNALSRLADLADGRPIEVKFDERDRYGRILGDVWVNGKHLNTNMVVKGAAMALAATGPYADQLYEAQLFAQANAVGLWSERHCGRAESSPLHIVSISSNPKGPDEQNLNGEWVDLVNVSNEPVSLEGWSMRDESTGNRFSFPSAELPAGAELRVYVGSGNNTNSEIYWGSDKPVWNNKGDTCYLVDPNGKFAAVHSYRSD